MGRVKGRHRIPPLPCQVQGVELCCLFPQVLPSGGGRSTRKASLPARAGFSFLFLERTGANMQFTGRAYWRAWWQLANLMCWPTGPGRTVCCWGDCCLVRGAASCDHFCVCTWLAMLSLPLRIYLSVCCYSWIPAMITTMLLVLMMMLKRWFEGVQTYKPVTGETCGKWLGGSVEAGASFRCANGHSRTINVTTSRQ